MTEFSKLQIGHVPAYPGISRHWVANPLTAGKTGRKNPIMTEQNQTTEQTPPPAATVVAQGERNEQVIQLEQELEAERKARKTAETIAAEWQDKARTLLHAQEEAAYAVRPAQKPAHRFPTLLH